MGIFTNLRDRLRRHHHPREAERDCWVDDPGPAEEEPPAYTAEQTAAAAFLTGFYDVIDAGLAMSKVEADEEREQARINNDDDPATISLCNFLDSIAEWDEGLRRAIAQEGLTPAEALALVQDNRKAFADAIDAYRQSNQFQEGYREAEVNAARDAKDELRRLTRQPEPEPKPGVGVEPRPFDPDPEPEPKPGQTGPRMTM